MSHKGFSHIGLSTLDLDKTREFYEGVLGFKPVVADTIKIEEGGRLRHIFFNVGRDQLIAFLEPNGVPDVPAKYDAGINRGLGVPAGFYHFAFEAGSAAGLAEKRDELRAKGVEVTDIVDHGWARSIVDHPRSRRGELANTIRYHLLRFAGRRRQLVSLETLPLLAPVVDQSRRCEARYACPFRAEL